MIFGTTAVLFLYILVRLILPSRLSRVGKAVAALLLLLVSQGNLLKTLFFGGMAAPALPSEALLLQGWLFSSLILLFLLTLARDILLLTAWAGRRLRRGSPTASDFSPDRRDVLTRGLAAMPALLGARPALFSGMAMLPSGYGVSQAVAAPVVRDLEVPLPGLAPELDGLTLVQASDTHISSLLRRDWAETLVDKINGCKPDVIVFTGDLADGPPAERRDDIAPFRHLRAPLGVFSCLGNHEYYSDYQGWMRLFPELGITMLHNRHVVLRHRDRELVLAGLTDPVAERFSLPMPDVRAALEGAPQGVVRILLDHRPGNAAHNAAAGVDLQLSGHTHGGHMVGLNELVARFNQGYVYGWYTVKGMPMYVNAGAGLWSGFPVRLGVPAEIARLTLRAAPGLPARARAAERLARRGAFSGRQGDLHA